MRDSNVEIEQCQQTGAMFEQMSDEAFAKGDPINGSKYFRLAIETYERAERMRARRSFFSRRCAS